MTPKTCQCDRCKRQRELNEIRQTIGLSVHAAHEDLIKILSMMHDIIGDTRKLCGLTEHYEDASVAVDPGSQSED